MDLFSMIKGPRVQRKADPTAVFKNSTVAARLVFRSPCRRREEEEEDVLLIYGLCVCKWLGAKNRRV